MFAKQDIAIDLGTANTLIFITGKGIVLNEPSVVAVTTGNTVLAAGDEAKYMIGRTPSNVKAIRPLKDGVIADFEATEAMLKFFLNKINIRKWYGPRILVCVPSEITMVEKKAVQEAVLSAGARHVYLMEEPMAAAIGANLPIHDPTGNMVIDIGGGTTEIAVISFGGIVVARSIAVAGDKIDFGIKQTIKRKYNVVIGDRTTEDLKIKLGSVTEFEGESDLYTEIRGRDVVAGVPKMLKIVPNEIREVIIQYVSQIAEAAKDVLDISPPELAGDIINNGIAITGGGGLIRGLDIYMSNILKVPVKVVDSPLNAIVLGAGKCIENIEVFEKIVHVLRK